LGGDKPFPITIVARSPRIVLAPPAALPSASIAGDFEPSQNFTAFSGSHSDTRPSRHAITSSSTGESPVSQEFRQRAAHHLMKHDRLGAYLNKSLAHPAMIVGVAKNRYRKSQHAVAVFRANSKRPLFVTAIGMGYDVAAQHVKSMAGQFRIPAIIKAVDRLSRTETES